MKPNLSNGSLNPIKLVHNNSSVLPNLEYTGTYNKTNEKITLLQFDLETTKDTILKLRAEIMNKNKEIQNLNFNKSDKRSEQSYTIKVIETALKILGVDLSEMALENMLKTDNNNNNNQNSFDNNNININQNNSIEANSIENEINDIPIPDDKKGENKNKNEKNDENKKKTISYSDNNNNIKLPRILKHLEKKHPKSPKGQKSINYKMNKEVPYIVCLKQQLNTLKELVNKKEEEMKEMQNNRNSANYSKLQHNFERNFTELNNIKKENEFMKTKIEDVSNLLFIEKEGNKSLKSKLQVFLSNFREFQESSDRKTTDLETKLIQSQAKERECRIFHMKRSPRRDGLGSKNSSKISMFGNEYNDYERLKFAEDEMKNIKNEIECLKNEINNKNKEIQTMNSYNNDLKNKSKEMKERSIQFKDEIKSLNQNLKDIKNTRVKLTKVGKELKNKYNNSNYNLTSQKNQVKKLKENLSKKEKEIIDLKRQIEQLKQNSNFKDGTFFTSIGAKGTSKKKNLQELDVNIDEEMAQIEKKYKMINEQKKIIEEKKEEEKNKNH